MNLERKGEPDKHGIVVLQWHCGIPLPYSFHPLNRHSHTCMYMSMHEYSYLDYIVFHVHIEKVKKSSHKKINIRKISKLHRIIA